MLLETFQKISIELNLCPISVNSTFVFHMLYMCIGFESYYVMGGKRKQHNITRFELFFISLRFGKDQRLFIRL